MINAVKLGRQARLARRYAMAGLALTVVAYFVMELSSSLDLDNFAIDATRPIDDDLDVGGFLIPDPRIFVPYLAVLGVVGVVHVRWLIAARQARFRPWVGRAIVGMAVAAAFLLAATVIDWWSAFHPNHAVKWDRVPERFHLLVENKIHEYWYVALAYFAGFVAWFTARPNVVAIQPMTWVGGMIALALTPFTNYAGVLRGKSFMVVPVLSGVGAAVLVTFVTLFWPDRPGVPRAAVARRVVITAMILFAAAMTELTRGLPAKVVPLAGTFYPDIAADNVMVVGTCTYGVGAPLLAAGCLWWRWAAAQVPDPGSGRLADALAVALGWGLIAFAAFPLFGPLGSADFFSAYGWVYVTWTFNVGFGVVSVVGMLVFAGRRPRLPRVSGLLLLAWGAALGGVLVVVYRGMHRGGETGDMGVLSLYAVVVLLVVAIVADACHTAGFGTTDTSNHQFSAATPVDSQETSHDGR